jgi:hypothetical protein
MATSSLALNSRLRSIVSIPSSVLQERLGVTRAEIDDYKPNEAVDAERQARRAELAQRLLRPFREFRDDRITRGSRKG